MVKGSSSPSGPILRPQQTKKANGNAVKTQKRRWIANVSQLKADFYTWLGKDDPGARGFVRFAVGLGDEYFRQITAEVRVLKRAASGVMVSRWEIVEPGRRNECLDTMNYAEAAARKRGWTAMTDGQWEILAMERGVAPKEAQPDLFDASASLAARATAQEPTEPQTETGRPATGHRVTQINFLRKAHGVDAE
jgi:phage terminase large subunit GpA-like protein